MKVRGRTLGDEIRDQNSGKQGRIGDRVQETGREEDGKS